MINTLLYFLWAFEERTQILLEHHIVLKDGGEWCKRDKNDNLTDPTNFDYQKLYPDIIWVISKLDLAVMEYRYNWIQRHRIQILCFEFRDAGHCSSIYPCFIPTCFLIFYIFY